MIDFAIALWKGTNICIQFSRGRVRRSRFNSELQLEAGVVFARATQNE